MFDWFYINDPDIPYLAVWIHFMQIQVYEIETYADFKTKCVSARAYVRSYGGLCKPNQVGRLLIFFC